jgi:hypothetical protein
LRTKLSRTLLALCAALLVLPAVASAQVPITPPGSDNYVDGYPLADPLVPGAVGFSADTTNYTTEGPNAFFDSPGEFNSCGRSVYGKTIWSYFHVQQTGRVDITAAGYDAVIGLASFASPQSAKPSGGRCTDRLSGRIESFPRDDLPTVSKGGWYAIQVGGFQDPNTGAIAGGPLEVDVELLPPEEVQGDAILTWRGAKGGIKVTSIKVSGPSGSAALVTCLRKKCGRDQTIRNPKLKGVFARPIAKSLAHGKSTAGGKEVPAPRKTVQVHSAASAFKGRTVKNGSRLLVVVLGQDQIGEAFFWDVKKNAAGAKSLGCVEPDGTSIQRPGTCDGK